MHCFFCESITTGSNTLSPDESRHLAKVLRLDINDSIVLIDGKGHTANATVTEIGRRGDAVSCNVSEIQLAQCQTPSIRLYVAPPKGKNMDLLLKEATELGVSRITPILCQYGVSRPDGNKEGWRQQLLVACKQSRNPWLPQIDAPMQFSDAVAKSTECSFLGAVPRDAIEQKSFDLAVASNQGIALWIGPEGGFTQQEENQLFDAGATALTVGKWILRVETAVPALLGAIYQIISNN